MKSFARALTVLVIVAGTSGIVLGVPTIKIQGGPYQAGSGGEFMITVMTPGIPGNAVGKTYPSFCIERNEYIRLGKTYYAVVSTKARKGGAGGPHPDPLDPRTAWLYNEFLNGTLPGYDFEDDDIGRKTSAAALQKAIWYLEEEISSVPSGSLAESFVQLAEASDWYQSGQIGNIRVLNLYRDSSLQCRAQDQLVRLPVPGAFLLTCAGVGLVPLIRRRRML